MDKQELRNALSAIEDEARSMRSGRLNETDHERDLANMIVQLSQIIRQELVK